MAQKNSVAPLVGIDVGSTHVSVIAGDVNNRDIHILGHARVHNSGIKRGTVVEFASLTDAIADAVDEVERQSGLDILHARVSISGSHVQSENTFIDSGLIKSGEVTQADVAKFLETMSKQKVQGIEAIHKLICYFKVDDLSEIESPIGFTGSKIGARIHRVNGNQAEIVNLIKACNQAGLRVDGFAYEPLAAAECMLDSDDKELGAASINIGYEQTHVAVYSNGYPIYSKVYGVGANHITKDLSVGLRTTLSEAERIKREFGHACSGGYEGLDKVVLIGTNGVQRLATRNEIVRIIYPRVHEIFTKIAQDMNTSQVLSLIRKGVVLSGGGAQLKGLCIVAEECFGQSARVAIAGRISGSVEGLRTPQWATLLGVLSPMFSNPFGEKNCAYLAAEEEKAKPSFLNSFKKIWAREKT